MLKYAVDIVIVNIFVHLPVICTTYHKAGLTKAIAWLGKLLWLVFFPQDWLLQTLQV